MLASEVEQIVFADLASGENRAGTVGCGERIGRGLGGAQDLHVDVDVLLPSNASTLGTGTAGLKGYQEAECQNGHGQPTTVSSDGSLQHGAGLLQHDRDSGQPLSTDDVRSGWAVRWSRVSVGHGPRRVKLALRTLRYYRVATNVTAARRTMWCPLSEI
jgi:hypothetical protein